ncbi:ABC transporter permease [Microbacterium hydrocarbonoxydans]|uniref:ABC transporter permease n=1 Tax=Microbacterium hydrocarbonoxydans TaxID=273678 RepID=UPI002040F3CB|nr:ABC transporter permease [Microbacterium hydrocarbonoxydans]MCM3778601.1 ABC transporter permease [Microbacterium hydrocarbonoxydans]
MSLVVVGAGVAAIVIPSSLAVGSSEAVTARLDSATSSRVTVLLPATFWDAGEATLLAALSDQPQIRDAGTLVPPDRTNGSVVVTNPTTDRTVESAFGVGTPSGLRTGAATVKTGGLGADGVVSDDVGAVYLGSRVARELDYLDVSAGSVLIDGKRFTVLGIIASDEAWISASVVFPPASARAAGYLPDNRVLTIETEGNVTGRLQQQIALALAPSAPETVTVLSSPSAQELRAEILSRGNNLTGLIGLIAGATGFLTLAATTFASLTERRREMGLYLALGYTRSFVSGQIVVEGTIVGLLGGIVGFLLGTLVAAGVSAASYPLFYLPTALLVLPAAAAVLGCVSALIPAWAATRVSPSELLRA